MGHISRVFPKGYWYHLLVGVFKFKLQVCAPSFLLPRIFLRLEVMASFTCCDCHQPHLNPKIQVPTYLVQHIQDIYIQDFKKNALFESYGIICLPCYVPRILSPRAIGSTTRGTNRLSTTCAIDWSIMLPFPIPGPWVRHASKVA